MTEKQPKPETYAPKFLELAEKNPKDPAAFDALAWVMSNSARGVPTKDDSRVKAGEALLRDHIASEKLGTICQSMAYGYDRGGEEFLRKVLEKSPHKSVQAEASLALAQRTSNLISIVRQVKESPELATRLEQVFGKDLADDLVKSDPVKLDAEADKLFKQFAEKYAADVPPERLSQLFMTLARSHSKANETVLRTLLEKDERKDVQGTACLALGQMLKSQADETASKDAAASEKMRKESETLLERAADKYADVKLVAYGTTVGKKAKSELFEIKHLSIGREAPDVEGEDQDGKKFKLSDYRGKVILLDFWSEF
jgi:AhpC/TSA family